MRSDYERLARRTRRRRSFDPSAISISVRPACSFRIRDVPVRYKTGPRQKHLAVVTVDASEDDLVAAAPPVAVGA